MAPFSPGRADIGNRLNLEVRPGMQSPDVRERLRHEGIDLGIDGQEAIY